MSVNGILKEYIIEKSNSHLELSEIKLSQLNSIVNNNDAEKTSLETTVDAKNPYPSLISTIIFLSTMSSIVIFHKIKLYHQAQKLKSLDSSPCKKCRFFADNSYLKCAVNPCTVLTASAINCHDYQPLKNKTKSGFPNWRNIKKVN
ncbi:hypothetical protein CLI64_15530 [Nostoc sp. CENA543]|uniref:hypothetical protein n=1 Tax=Nostoc sp. CENA543 TaxID=1869241 RepID=UPI000CA1092F|nr:hypothetical protein [Nostoc sp. CENA543]AUT01681.1 hypothetical protein CLI64_15530 [Nostoc sp. CENA543]